MRPVVRRNAGRDAFARFDGNRERRLVPGLVGRRHELQIELLGAVARQRKADEPAPVLRHEVHGFRRAHLRRNDKIAFVLAVLGIDQNEHLAVARVLDDVLDRGEIFLVHGSQSF